MQQTAEYRVRLDCFQGPLDLLLFLVRRHEIDILDLPMAAVTQQYLHYLEDLATIDLDRAGDFLFMASTLIEIKSRMMLPTPPQEEDEPQDPRGELVQQLLEYKKFKDASSLLQQRADQWAAHYPRRNVVHAPRADAAEVPIQEVELWDLVSAFDRLMRETLAATTDTVVYDETPLEVHMQQVEDRLILQGRLKFRDLFTGAASKSQLIGIFLALLELVRIYRVSVEQEGDFGDILVSRNAAAHPPDDTEAIKPTGCNPWA